MQFDWQQRPLSEWRELIKKAPRANWLQSLPFARAVRVRDQKTTCLATILQDNVVIGMMAIHEIKLGPIHILNLYRGPLWFSENPPREWLVEFAKEFNRVFPRRILRRRRWLPEWRSRDGDIEAFTANGFSDLSQTYETIWIDLQKSEQEIRKNFSPNWRGPLAKAERLKVDVRVDWKGVSTTAFLKEYEIDKNKKKYKGRSAKFLKEEIVSGLHYGEVLFVWAFENSSAAASVLIFLHGNSASYRAGWTNEIGRRLGAHNLLLWRAVQELKKKGIHNFDLGGIIPNGASGEGVSQFKRGMGGEEFKLPGVFA